MRHLIICREYPPAPYPAGGIGTYVRKLSRLLAEDGETVHVIGQRWQGAPARREEFCDGRLIVHRVQLEPGGSDSESGDPESRALFASNFPPQAFGWNAGLLAERLVQEEGIDLIEAQEWEAPLYYFQLRRALGLGPARQPPCIVHLHSPTEFIVRHNEWDPSRTDYLMAKRQEDYSIAAADAWLCPSSFLARRAEHHYHLPANSIQVIPLPLGGAVGLKRTPKIWQNGAALYVGRLEPRKGVLEWIAAAVLVAARRPEARFEFVGTDLPYSHSRSVLETARHMIPAELESRFLFHGEQPQSELPGFLSRARIAVVPSRWENFPNTCVEAMGSGLPVLATRQGGMAEMITDGQTGWLADRAEPGCIAAALERALDTSPDQLASMGERAAAAIGRMCDDAAVTRAHLEYRQRIVCSGAQRSSRIPANGRPLRSPTPDAGKGIAVILRRRERGDQFEECLRRLNEQTVRPELIAIIEAGDEPCRAAREAAHRMGIRPLGYLFLEHGPLPEPALVEACARTLERCHEVGVVSSWNANPDALTIGPSPTFPYQLLRNDAGTSIAVRAAALEQLVAGEPDLPPDYALWAVVNAVLALGWAAVTYPALLLTRDRARTELLPVHWRAWPRILAQSPPELAEHAPTLLVLLRAELDRLERKVTVVPREHTSSATTTLRLPALQRIAVLREAARRPRRAAGHFVHLTRGTLGRAARRLFGVFGAGR